MASEVTNCTNKDCAKEVRWIDLFPNGLCVDCWAETPEGRYVPTAKELAMMWGGK